MLTERVRCGMGILPMNHGRDARATFAPLPFSHSYTAHLYTRTKSM